MGKTITKGALLTLALMPVLSYQPIQELEVDKPLSIHTTMPSNTSSSNFKPDYVMIDDKIREIPTSISNELETISSLLEIGNILFENSRNESPEELHAMRSYFKSKYKKV